MPFYAKAILASGLEIDMLFGPAYKGIPLVAVSALALAQAGRNLLSRLTARKSLAKVATNIIGAPLVGRVLIIDDVISAEKDMKAGYMDINGKFVIPFSYLNAGSFSEELTSVGNSKNGYGFIDKTGKQIIPSFIYDNLSFFNNGYAVVEKVDNGFTDILMSDLSSLYGDYTYSTCKIRSYRQNRERSDTLQV